GVAKLRFVSAIFGVMVMEVGVSDRYLEVGFPVEVHIGAGGTPGHLAANLEAVRRGDIADVGPGALDADAGLPARHWIQLRDEHRRVPPSGHIGEEPDRIEKVPSLP